MTQPITRRYVVSVLLIAAVVLTTALWLAGQPWWCSCGQAWISSWDIWSVHNSQHLLDPYSFSHLLHGMIFYLAFLPLTKSKRLSFLLAAVVESGWEMLENSPIVIERYRAATLASGYSGDSIANSLSDLIVCLCGFWLASKLPTRVAILLVLLIDLTSTLLIRDGLFLNVLMLVYPIPAIREWQTALRPVVH